MRLVLYILLLLIFALLIYQFRRVRLNTILTIIFSVLIIYFILNPFICIESSLKGIKLFFNSVFPTLFPFLVITNLLMLLDGISIYSKYLGNLLCYPLRLSKESSFAIIVSFLCGYPLGAKYSCELYSRGDISTKEFQRLMNIASNTSPLFLIGAIATSMLNNTKSGYILLFANYLSCILMAFILPGSITIKNSEKNKTMQSNSLGVALIKAVENSISTTLTVGGFIVIFSVIISIIKNNAIYNIVLYNLSNILNISSDFISGFLLGILEITNGCYYISLSPVDWKIKLSVISFLCSFSGLCIISQVSTFTYKFKEYSMKTYIARKLLQGFISFLITYTLSLSLDTTPAINLLIYNNFLFSPIFILLVLVLLLLIPLFISFYKKLFNIS